MKVDFSKPLKGLDGEPLRVPAESGEGLEVMTLGLMSINVLLTTLIDQRTGQVETVSPADKVRFAKLAQDIYGSTKPIDISVDDVSLLKERIGRAGSPLAVARAWEILDPPEAADGNTASDRRVERQSSGA